MSIRFPRCPVHGNAAIGHVSVWLLVSIIAVLITLIVTWQSDGSQAALIDDESWPGHQSQYYDWEHAHPVPSSEWGEVLVVRKDGGGDLDFLRLDDLTVGDLVSVQVNHSTRSETVEYLVSTPDRFPIWVYYFDGSSPTTEFTIEFAVLLQGSYYIHTGRGIGVAFSGFNITVSGSGGTGDGNDSPAGAEELQDDTPLARSIGQPLDPADFYVVHLAPVGGERLYIGLVLVIPEGAYIQWELYNSTGVRRSSLSYDSDTMKRGSSEGFLPERIHSEDDYYLRIWAIEGSGEYTITVNVTDYVDEDDDDFDTAVELFDGSHSNGTVHALLDPLDFFKIMLTGGSPLHVWLEVDGDADIFLYGEDRLRYASSTENGTRTEYIHYRVPSDGTGWYYLKVEPYSTEPPVQTIRYHLWVLTNLYPEVSEAYAEVYANRTLKEDVVDDGVLLDRLFYDPEGGTLTFDVLPGHNTTLLNVTITVDARLSITPAPNASDLSDRIEVRATDDHGYSVAFGIGVVVVPVNDPPQLGPPWALEPPAEFVLDEDGSSEPIEVLHYFWDIDDSFWELTVSARGCDEVGATVDPTGRLILATLVEDWSGWCEVTLTARDPGGLTANMTVPVHVRPVNDPPRLLKGSIEMTVDEGPEATVDLSMAFRDVEGEQVEYTLLSDIGVGHMFVDSTLVISGLSPYQGRVIELRVTATDIHGAVSDPLTITLSILDLPDPPAVTSSMDGYTTVEGSELVFLDFDITDPDPFPRDYIIVLEVGTWSSRSPVRYHESGIDFTTGPPRWTPDIQGRDRWVNVTLIVRDGGFNASLSWTVHIQRLNRPPHGVEIVAENPGPYRTGDPIVLKSEPTDDDGDPLTLRWRLDGTVDLGDSTEIVLRGLPPGLYNVSLTVDDGIDQVETHMDILVFHDQGEQGSDGTMLIPAAAMVAAAVIGTLGLYLFLRRRLRNGRQ